VANVTDIHETLDFLNGAPAPLLPLLPLPLLAARCLIQLVCVLA
jgi:hypothetical protein